MRKIVLVTALAAASLLLTRDPVGAAREPEGLPPELATPYRLERETYELPEAVAIQVSTAALRFYRPPASQRRWIDARLLSDRPKAGPDSMTSGTVDSLISRLGHRFQRWDDPTRTNFPGGHLRLSRVHATSPDTARLVVRYRHVTPETFGPASCQVFVLARSPKGWQIAARGGAPLPAEQND